MNDQSSSAMNPMAFINKWGQSALKESAAYQDHFRDLCRLVGYTVSPEEEAGLFQKHVEKISGAKGFADVWLKGKFAIEYKSPGEDLDKAYQQLQDYRDALGNPPLMVVSDTRRIRITTNFTGTTPLKHDITPSNFEMRRALHGLNRYLVTPCLSKHRVFAWVDGAVLPDHALIAFATNRDADFGLLQSRIHEIWALAMCSALEDRPRYTPNTTFETFPFRQVR